MHRNNIRDPKLDRLTSELERLSEAVLTYTEKERNPANLKPLPVIQRQLSDIHQQIREYTRYVEKHSFLPKWIVIAAVGVLVVCLAWLWIHLAAIPHCPVAPHYYIGNPPYSGTPSLTPGGK